MLFSLVFKVFAGKGIFGSALNIKELNEMQMENKIAQRIILAKLLNIMLPPCL